MESFEYTAAPCRVLFGFGTLEKLPSELNRLGLRAPLILSTPYQVDQVNEVMTILGERAAGIFSQAEMHTPLHITTSALARARILSADSLVSIGGGSTIGLGKAVSIRTGLPHICIPTTYAGSEMTPILGETSNGEKRTRKDPKIRPDVVIYDVRLTLTMPTGMSATSGVNAIAHAVEALYSNDTNPIVNLMAIEGVASLVSSLPKIIKNPQDSSARSSALYGAWLCGTCLGSAGMSLHHKLCHVLGGTLSLPHAEVHTIVLPHAISYNAPAIEDTMKKLANVLPESEGDAVAGFNKLLSRLEVPRALRDLGMREGDIDVAVEITMKTPYWNLRPVERGPLRELIRRAWAGEDARADI